MTIYVEKERLIADKQVSLNSNKSNYLSRVMRCKEGDIVEVIDGLGGRYEASIQSITKKGVSLFITRHIGFDSIFYKTILLQAIVKGQSMDKIIREVVECGIKEVYPIITERTIVRNTDKIKRWQYIAEEASEQSGRSYIPIIHSPITMKSIKEITDIKAGSCKLVFDRTGSDLQDCLNQYNANSDIFFVIGPEGGLTFKEIDILINIGFIKVSIGPYTLKSETAGPLATSLIHYFINKMTSKR